MKKAYFGLDMQNLVLYSTNNEGIWTGKLSNSTIITLFLFFLLCDKTRERRR